MKKSLIFVGLLAIGYANAQEGNVGINTDNPKATLDIQPNADNAKATSTTNQGILAPRLSKARIANIATPVEGTLVYALDENTTEYPNSLISDYTGTDTKVAKITEKGYYYYNGTAWVSATDTNTTYTAGYGLELDGTEFSIPVYKIGLGNVVTNVIATPDGIGVQKGNPAQPGFVACNAKSGNYGKSFIVHNGLARCENDGSITYEGWMDKIKINDSPNKYDGYFWNTNMADAHPYTIDILNWKCQVVTGKSRNGEYFETYSTPNVWALDIIKTNIYVCKATKDMVNYSGLLSVGWAIPFLK